MTIHEDELSNYLKSGFNLGRFYGRDCAWVTSSGFFLEDGQIYFKLLRGAFIPQRLLGSLAYELTSKALSSLPNRCISITILGGNRLDFYWKTQKIVPILEIWPVEVEDLFPGNNNAYLSRLLPVPVQWCHAITRASGKRSLEGY